MQHEKAIVIGAGIVGLATAKILAEKGYSVTVFERNEKAVGASIRNFGMLWPIGQPDGQLYQRALRSKAVWQEVCQEAGLWHNESGSLHLAYNDLEWQVIQEFAAAQAHRPIRVLTAAEATAQYDSVNPKELLGALWSGDEMIVEARVAIQRLPAYLQQKYGVQFHFNTAITSIDYPVVYSGKRKWEANAIYVCSGADFETLYPDVFTASGITKCKLQMMRLVSQPEGWRIGPSLCGGLSLMHYKGFEVASTLPELKQYYTQTMQDYLKWGIHVMVSQNGEGELTVGDSHEYGLVHDPFDKEFINRMILDYLKTFARFKDWQLLQSWNGIYAKRTDGATEFIHRPEEGVTIINGLGGAGMTLSFGLAEEVVQATIGTAAAI